MPSMYQFEIEARIALGGDPIATKTVTFSTSDVYIVTALKDQARVVLVKSGETEISHDIPVGAGPCEISRGGGSHAFVACREARTLDVIDQCQRLKQIFLPGPPSGLAWNGAFRRGKRRIMVTCETSPTERGTLCVIDEQKLEIVNMLQIGHKPRGICLDRHRKLLFVANHGDDSVYIVDEHGRHIMHSVATAGRPLGANYSWADQDHIIISLDAGGVLQRLDASRLPPELSGLTALRRGPSTKDSMTPTSCVPLGQDDLWLAPDQYSEAMALIISNDNTFEQIDSFCLGDKAAVETGLGQIAVATPGLPGRVYVANRYRQELLLVRIFKRPDARRRRRQKDASRETLSLRSRSASLP